MHTPRIPLSCLSVSLFASLLLAPIARAVPGSPLSLVPVAGLGMPTPYPAAALLADSALANFATYDLVAHLQVNERFVVGNMFTSLDGSTYSALPGMFYAPATISGRADADVPQLSAYHAFGGLNYKYDSWVNGILTAPDLDGNYWTGTLVAELSTNITPNAPSQPIFPRTSSNHLAQGGADLARNAISLEWIDQNGASGTYPMPADYTIARLTFNAGAGGGFLVGDVDSNRFVTPFTLQLPVVPEPASIVIAAMAAMMIVRRRSN